MRVLCSWTQHNAVQDQQLSHADDHKLKRPEDEVRRRQHVVAALISGTLAGVSRSEAQCVDVRNAGRQMDGPRHQ